MSLCGMNPDINLQMYKPPQNSQKTWVTEHGLGGPSLKPWAGGAFTGKDFPLTVRLTPTYFSIILSNSLSFNCYYFQFFFFCLFSDTVNSTSGCTGRTDIWIKNSILYACPNMKIIYSVFLQTKYILKQRSYLVASGPNGASRLRMTCPELSKI